MAQRKSFVAAETLSVPAELPRSVEGTLDSDTSYQMVLAEARLNVGHGGIEGAFPEEWDAQLLVECGFNADGERIVLFCPKFLAPVLDDPNELDRAFRFIILKMDGYAMHGKYVFVYCYLGMDWSDPGLAQRMRLAYDILPEQYAENLTHFYVLHPTSGFRVSMWTFWSWMSTSIWGKLEYVHNVEALCQLMYPGDLGTQAELHRRFPQIVQRQDAGLTGHQAAVVFGIPLGCICHSFGVDFTDQTTGRWYPRLPPALIFLCEAMEREAADDHIADIYDVDAASVYRVVQAVDEGQPLERNMSMPALWCALKLFLDCLPSPLLSFGLMDELKQRNVGEADVSAHRALLKEAFHQWLPREEAYVALYLASFLHTLCENAREKREGSEAKAGDVALTPALAAKVFGASFARPREMSREARRWSPAARALVETLVREAEDPEFWIGSHAVYEGSRAEESSDEGDT